MRISNKFWELIAGDGPGVTLKLRSTGAVLTVTNDELEMLYAMLAQLHE
jgi:hypothetical protein